ncbi:MAG: trigger factor [Planctomycetota bacterium]|nr:trigger factor [Planctomycetota bacterium]
MQVSVDTSESSLAKISVSIPPDEFEKEYRGALKQAGRNVQMKGFRPGKVPVKVVEKKFGEEVTKDVIEHFVRQAYQQAVSDEDLKPLSHPRIAQEDLSRGEDGGFSVEFEVSLKPSFDLPDYKGMVIESELEQVVPDQVEATIEQLRRERSTPEPVGPEGMDANGMALCTVRFLHGEEVVFEREGLRLGANTPPPGVKPEDFEGKFDGAVDGDVIECPMMLPPTIEKAEARGADGTCRIEVAEAYKLVPPADEELFALVEVEDMDAFRVKVREKLEEANTKRERDRVEGALIDRLIAETTLDLPGPMLEEQTQHRLHALAQEMSRQGVPEDAIKQQLEEQEPTAREEADKGMRALLIVEAIGDAEELLVTNAELEAELANIAERNHASLEDVREYYVKQGLTQQMAIEVLERKVRKFLYENAEVKDPS